MPTIPNSLALTSIADGALMVASDERNNFTAVQTALNSLIATLAAGTSGQVLQSGGGTSVAWGPAYTAYTPTWSGGAPAIGNGTITARYLQIGKFVHYFGQITFGTTTTPGGGASYGISMPINIQNGFAGSAARMTGVIQLYHQATNSSMFAWADNTGSVSAFFIAYPATYGGTLVNANSTAPWAWGSGDFIAWNMIYEGV